MFPNPAALLRLNGWVLVDAHDEWRVADNRYLSETTLALLKPSDKPAEIAAATPALTAYRQPESLTRNTSSAYTTRRDATT